MKYLINEDESKITLSKTFLQMRDQVRSWNAVKEKYKVRLYEFILKIIENHKQDIKKFYESFTIETVDMEFNSFTY